MTSKIFRCSRQRAMHIAQEVLKDMNLRKGEVDVQNARIQAYRKWGFLRPSKEVEITMYADDARVEVAVNIEPSIKVLDFGTSQYLEEEFLHRLKERIN